MSNNTSVSIQSLPVEILHRIFDSLDAPTILFSIRPVCRSFRAIVNTYDRYTLDFKSISKPNFHLLCRLINPRNVRSLRLFDDSDTPNCINLFISSMRLRQFTQLHSITFSGIEESELNIMLKCINPNLLTSCSLDIRKYDDRRRKTTNNYLSLILARPNLRKVELGIRNYRISSLSWPLNSRIEYLVITNEIDFDTVMTILSRSTQLHTLILKQNIFNSLKDTTQTYSFSQVTSLTLEKFYCTIDQLESFLLLMPSLIYLKLIGERCLLDGERWKEFIRMNHPHLNTFEFFISIFRPTIQRQEDLQLIIESFRSPFWIEYKKWFVACQVDPGLTYRILLYSIPICKPALQYELGSASTYACNSTMFLDNDPFIMKNINEIIFLFKRPTFENGKKEVCYKMDPIEL